MKRLLDCILSYPMCYFNCRLQVGVKIKIISNHPHILIEVKDGGKKAQILRYFHSLISKKKTRERKEHF